MYTEITIKCRSKGENMIKQEKGKIIKIVTIVIVVFIFLFSLYETALKNTKYYTIANGEIYKFDIINSFNGNSAEKAGNEFLQKISEGKYNLENVEKSKYVKAGEPYIEVIEDNYEMRVNIVSNKVIYYRDKDYDILDNNTITEEQAKEHFNHIVTKYNISKEYELMLIEPSNLGLWHAEICKKENNIFNIYKSIKIDFMPTEERIVFWEFKGYIFTDNETKISQEEAENIAKETYEEKDVVEIKSQECIEQVTDRKITCEINFGDEIELESASELITYMNEFKENRQIRNVWEVQLINDEGRTAIYDIDKTDGTLIRKAYI